MRKEGNGHSGTALLEDKVKRATTSGGQPVYPKSPMVIWIGAES